MRVTALATQCGLLACITACHTAQLEVVTSSLVFSSPDQPAELTQPDAGLVQIAFGQVSVGSVKTLTLDFASMGSPVTLGAISAVQPDVEFGLPFVAGTTVQATPSQITVSFAPSSAGDKVAEYLLSDSATGVETVRFELSGEGAVTGLSVSPNPVDFGDVELTQSQSLVLTLSNVSQLSESLELPPLQGPRAARFSLGMPSARMLAPGDSATLSVAFEPFDLGGSDASLTISAGPGVLPVTVDLGGVGVNAWLQLTPALSFGFVPVGDTIVKAAAVTNTASYRTLHLVSPAPFTSQASGNAFSVGAQAPAIPAAIAPGQSVEIPVSFAPPDLDAFTGTLYLMTDDPSVPTLAAQLQGYGGGPRIFCQPELSFGPVGVGETVSADSICANAGTTIPSHADLALQIAQSELRSDASAFVPHLVLPDGGLAGAGYSVSLSVGELTRIRVGFQPADAGVFQDRLTVPSNDIEELDAGTLLVAEGVAAGPCNLSLVPPELGFGEVPSGDLGILQFELSNVGGNLCFVTQVGLDSSSDPAFWLTETPVSPLVLSFPGETDHPGLPSSVSLTVGFSPTTMQVAASGKVDIVTLNGLPPDQSIGLTATSQPACLSVQPPYFDFGPVEFNSASQQGCAPDGGASFTIVNSCAMPVTLSQIALNSGLDAIPQFTLENGPQLPLLIEAGGQASFEAGFTPTSAGTKVEAIGVTSSDLPNNPLMVTLRGDAELTGSHTDTFTVPVLTKQVDVLWVLEDDDNQDTVQVRGISAMAAKLISEMNADQLDYQMAVTSTDTCSASNADRGALEPCDHCLSTAGSYPELITPATTSTALSLTFLFAAFTISPAASSCGPINGGEHFFDAIADALSFPLLSGHNAGFIRNGAFLSVIVVSGGDEDDGAGSGPYLTSLAQAVTDVQSVKGDPKMASVSYINSGAGTFNTSQRIGQLVADTGGVEIDTTQPAAVWQASLLDLFPSDLTEGARFHLSAALGSLTQFQVEVDGTPTGDWTLDRSTNDIVFSVGNPLAEGATVTVTYDVECP